MVRLLFTLGFISALVLSPVIAGSSGNSIGGPLRKQNPVYILKTLTVYNPTVFQCDKTPLITASNAVIDIDKLHRQQIRWMALSRDMLKRWKGQFAYGDTVLLSAGDPAVDGQWVIHDNLNKRYVNRGDLLFDSRVRTLGKWENVAITKK